MSAFEKDNVQRYNAHLYSEGNDNALDVEPVPAMYDADPEVLDGRQVLQRNFDVMFERDAGVLTFGEDTGGIGESTR